MNEAPVGQFRNMRSVFSLAAQLRVAVLLLGVVSLLVMLSAWFLQRDLSRELFRGQAQMPAVMLYSHLERRIEVFRGAGEKLRSLTGETDGQPGLVKVREARAAVDVVADDFTTVDPTAEAVLPLKKALEAYHSGARSLTQFVREIEAALIARERNLGELDKSHAILTNSIDALLDGPVLNLLAGIDKTLSRTGSQEKLRLDLREYLWTGIDGIRHVGGAKAEANLIYATLTQAWQADDSVEIRAAQERFSRLAQRLRRSLDTEANAGLAGLPTLAENLLAFGEGTGSVFERRRGMLELASRRDAAISAMQQADQRIEASLAALREHMARKVTDANAAAAERVHFTEVLLFGLVGTALVTSWVIAWWLVGRRFSRRLKYLLEDMELVRGGQPIQASRVQGRDELAEFGGFVRDMSRHAERVTEQRRANAALLEAVESGSVRELLEQRVLLELRRDWGNVGSVLSLAPPEGAEHASADNDRISDRYRGLEEIAALRRGSVVLKGEHVDLVGLVRESAERLSHPVTSFLVEGAPFRLRADRRAVSDMCTRLFEVLAAVARDQDGGLAVRCGRREQDGVPFVSVSLLGMAWADLASVLGVLELKEEGFPSSAGTAQVVHSLGLLYCDAVVCVHDGMFDIGPRTGEGPVSVSMTFPVKRIIRRQPSRRGLDGPASGVRVVASGR